MLEVEGLAAGYGEARVLDGVSFRVRDGEMTCILGPNGAGKTTLLRAVIGLLPPAAGSIRFRGEEIRGRRTHAVVGMGMTMVPEGRRLWPSLSVRENLEMGAYGERDAAVVRDRLSRVFALFPHLASREAQACGTLSGGEQQMAAIGRALMGAPRLLLMDEPSLGLAPRVVRDVFEAVREIVAAGTTVLLVEQNIQAALAASRYGYVLEMGRITLEGEAPVLRETSHIKEAYLGL
ncbi:MAG: ABC transporter ATP-binding protein [Deltaproteobacteria bacterium]